MVDEGGIMNSANSELTQSSAPSRAESLGGSATVTLGIMALNVAMFVLMTITGVSFLDPSVDSLIKWGANYGPLTLGGQWWRMFTSLFLHIGVIHLLCNMVVLASIGPFIETLAGSTAYLILYIVAGLGGGAASLAWHPWTVSAGASGAIFGLYGALLAFLLRHRNSIPPEVLVPLRKGAIVFVGYNVLYGLFRPDVDLTAHFGGLITGFLVGLVLVEPSSQDARSDRGWRNGLATVLGLALLIATLAGLTKPGDFLGEVKRMSGVEEKALALFNSSLEKWKADQLTDPQFLNVVEHQVLPGWRAERQSLEKLNGLSREQTQLTSSLIRYMKAREDSWSWLVDGVRTGDENKIRRAGKKGDEAEQLAQKIGATDNK
jgi:rhomboid protease GluP